jgi:hypothetical protein
MRTGVSMPESVPNGSSRVYRNQHPYKVQGRPPHSIGSFGAINRKSMRHWASRAQISRLCHNPKDAGGTPAAMAFA